MTFLALTLLSSTVFAQEGAADSPTSEVAKSVEESGRLRWGAGAKAGFFFHSPPEAVPVAGIEGRLGYQFGRRLALLGTVELGTIRESIGLGPQGNGVLMAAWVSGSVLAELTFFDHLFVALGPGLAMGGWNSYSYGDIDVQGVTPTLDLRVGLALGGRDASTGRRSHFSLGLELLVLFGSGPHYALNDFQPRVPGPTELAVNFAPSLMLGYDAR